MNIEDMIAQETANREEFEERRAKAWRESQTCDEDFYARKILHSTYVIYVLEQYLKDSQVETL